MLILYLSLLYFTSQLSANNLNTFKANLKASKSNFGEHYSFAMLSTSIGRFVSINFELSEFISRPLDELLWDLVFFMDKMWLCHCSA